VPFLRKSFSTSSLSFWKGISSLPSSLLFLSFSLLFFIYFLETNEPVSFLWNKNLPNITYLRQAEAPFLTREGIYFLFYSAMVQCKFFFFFFAKFQWHISKCPLLFPTVHCSLHITSSFHLSCGIDIFLILKTISYQFSSFSEHQTGPDWLTTYCLSRSRFPGNSVEDGMRAILQWASIMAGAGLTPCIVLTK
jgi:hypothetical protein